jgi:signal transduction histidine kinase
VALVATSLGEHEHALEGLAGALLIGGPLALIVAGALGFATAAGALRPVEHMRRRASTISRADATAHLPVPDVDDELRRLSLTLNEMLDRLALAADTERRFIANASHELRTPLAALRAELELARRPGRSAEELYAALGNMQADAERLVALSHSLLELSAADAGARRPHEAIAVDDLLLDVQSQMLARARAAGRAIHVERSGLSITGDPVALRRAVANLADNALLHGRGDVVLGAGDEHDPPAVILWVRDEGHVPADVRAIAFERFTRGPDTASRPGAGLGLSLVKAIAEHHGGDAALEDLGGGAGVRAVVRIPT